jgi:hypothetical protein
MRSVNGLCFGADGTGDRTNGRRELFAASQSVTAVGGLPASICTRSAVSSDTLFTALRQIHP